MEFLIGIYDFFSAILGGLVCLFFAPIFIGMYFVAFWWVLEKFLVSINLSTIKLPYNISVNKYIAWSLYLIILFGWFGLSLYLLKFDYNPLHLAMDILPGAQCN